VQPIVDGTFGTRDFTKLLVSRRSIFQREEFLTGNNALAPKQDLTSTGGAQKSAVHELPYYTKFIICAAYLASYNPPRQDRIYFMKTTERKRRRRGGTGGGRVSKHRKVSHLHNRRPWKKTLLILCQKDPQTSAQSLSIFIGPSTGNSLLDSSSSIRPDRTNFRPNSHTHFTSTPCS
jgi:hypothetical protein